MIYIMDVINKEIIEGLKDDMVGFFTRVNKMEDVWKIMKDGADEYGEEGQASYWLMIYLSIMLKENGVPYLVNLLKKSIEDEKVIKDFIYDLIKLDYKKEVGMWSWNEIEEMDINIDDIKDCTTKYSFF